MKWKNKALIISTASVLGVSVLSVGGLYGYKQTLTGKYMPGTYLAGENISKMTPDEVKNKMASKIDSYEGINLKLSLNGEEKELTLKGEDAKILGEETFNSIKTIKPEDISIIDLFSSPTDSSSIEFLSKINEDKLISFIDNEFNLHSLSPKNATFEISEGGSLEIVSEKSGKVLDSEKLIKEIKQSVGKFEKQAEIEISLIDQEPIITKSQLEPQKERILSSLEHKITLVDPIYSDPWYLTLSENLDWVYFEEKDDQIALKIKQEKLNEFIDAEISEWLDLPVESVNISKDENGNVVINGKGNDGKKIQREIFKNAIEVAAANKIAEIIIPVKTVQPEVVISEDLQKLGIKDRISVGHTSFYGSTANRVHNVKTGAARFNGIMIAPGEEFSFNTTLGDVNGATGYKMELVIKADGTVPEYGGGLCQVSTTMYRAALHSDVDITARRPHSYAVSYYAQVDGHGLDATIYLGGQDLKWKNNTEGHILVQAYVLNDYELYFIFYGTDTGKEVKLDGPYLSNYHSPGGAVYIESNKVGPGQTKQVEVPHTGFDALWYKSVTDETGETITEPLLSKYKAVPAKFLVNNSQPEVTGTSEEGG